MRILRIRRRHVHHADRQLTRLVHKTTQLRCLIHVASRRLRHSIAILRGSHEIRVESDVATRGALHLRASAARIQSLPVEALTRIRLRERRHIGVRGRSGGGSGGWSWCAGWHGVDVVIVLGIAQGYLRRRRQLSRRLRRCHGVRDGRRRCKIHRRGRRRWYHLQTVGELLQLGEATRIRSLMITGGREGRRRGVRVRRHRARLYVEVGSGSAGRGRT